MRRNIVVGTLLLALVTAAGCGGAGDSGSDAADKPAAAAEDKKNDSGAGLATAVGKPLSVKGQSGAAAEVTVLKVTLAKAGKGEAADKPANGQYAVVEVQIKVTKGQFAVNPLYVQYQSADGKTYESGDGNASYAGFEPELQSGDLPEGQSTRGLVVFDVPAGKGKQIQLTDELGSLVGVWQI